MRPFQMALNTSIMNAELHINILGEMLQFIYTAQVVLNGKSSLESIGQGMAEILAI